MAHSPNFPRIELDRESGLPLGTQLGWRLRTLIASERLAEGERLPGVREMAELAGVNVNTVRSVYSRLADDGVIVSEHGRGTFVKDAAAAREGLDRVSAALRGDEAEPPTPAAAEASPAAVAEARRRASLRAEIALLERELATVEPTNGVNGPSTIRRPTPQLLTAAELETIRDALVERLMPLRAERTVVRDERERERHEPGTSPEAQRQRAIATSTPRFEAGPGGWSLRWGG